PRRRQGGPMMLRRTLVAILLPALAYADAPARLAAGDRVLGNFGGNAYWYPATVTAVEGDRYQLRYDDGSTETVARSGECQLAGEDWVAVKVTATQGANLDVAGDDGAKRSSPIAKCRTDKVPPDPERVAREEAAMKSLQGTLDKLANSPRIDEDKVNCNK